MKNIYIFAFFVNNSCGGADVCSKSMNWLQEPRISTDLRGLARISKKLLIFLPLIRLYPYNPCKSVFHDIQDFVFLQTSVSLRDENRIKLIPGDIYV